MAERLKRWESPRKRGRNDKGKGGSARARQLRKREQMLRQKLKNKGKQQEKSKQRREVIPSLFFGKLNYIVVRQFLRREKSITRNDIISNLDNHGQK